MTAAHLALTRLMEMLPTYRDLAFETARGGSLRPTLDRDTHTIAVPPRADGDGCAAGILHCLTRLAHGAGREPQALGETVRLLVADGYSPDAIAEHLGIPIDSVHAALRG